MKDIAKKLAAAIVAFDESFPGDPDADIEVPADVWARWVAMALAAMKAPGKRGGNKKRKLSQQPMYSRTGEPWSGQEWAFSCGCHKPEIKPGERVYVVCEGRLVGYAPLVRLENVPGKNAAGRWLLIRGGGAVACTIDRPIVGFMGFRYRWWKREEEKPIAL